MVLEGLTGAFVSFFKFFTDILFILYAGVLVFLFVVMNYVIIRFHIYLFQNLKQFVETLKDRLLSFESKVLDKFYSVK